jgi:hypothetical protein
MVLINGQLTGTLPPSLSQLTNLEFVYLYGNRLTGTIERAFDPSIQTQLRAVDLSANGFTGTLPDVLFQNPGVYYIYVGGNCFHGTIPDAVCESTSLIGLGLDCLSCGDSCTSHLVAKSNFFVHHSVHGTIPPCIFHLSRLDVLYLDKNALSGSLPGDLQIKSSALSTVDLSYNLLTGHVPTSLLTFHNCYALFLSNNRFTGNVANNVQVNEYAHIKLSYNRLSGAAFGANWPADLSLDVLTGNILQCRSDRDDLPPQDSAYDRYQCSSTSVNQPLIGWLVTAGSLTALAAALWRWKDSLRSAVYANSLLDRLQSWRAAVHGGTDGLSSPRLQHVLRTAKTLERAAVFAAAAALLLLAPIYVTLSEFYGTYKHQYAWVLSATLLSGHVSFALCFVGFILVLSGSVTLLFHLYIRQTAEERRSTGADAAADDEDKNTDAASRRWRVRLACGVYITVNFLVVGTVNTAFVATSVYTSAIYQLGISVFKVGWNIAVAPFFSRWLAYELNAGRADWFTIELFVSIMNNIGIPLLAVLFTSPQCLYYAFGGQITSLVGKPFNYDSPFYYSYQCSYVFLDYYAAAYVYMCLMATFGTPLIELTAFLLHSCARPGGCWYGALTIILPRILKPLETDVDRIPDRSILRPYFDTTQFLVAQITYLALILTVGVIYPPVAASVALTMVGSTAFVMLKVGRLLTNTADAKQPKYADIIEQECSNVATGSTMRRAFWILLWCGCWFYTLFLFDTLGDAVGFQRAYWVIITVPLLPLMPSVIALIWPYLRRPGSDAVEKRDHDSELDVATQAEGVQPPYAPYDC